MAAKSKKKSFNFDSGLFILLSLSLLTSVLTLRKFNKYQKQIDKTVTSNLDIMRNEYQTSLQELKKVVNSGLTGQSITTNRIEKLDSKVKSESKIDKENVYRSLPSGLSICCAGDWRLTDGTFDYRLGDISPIGIITNITKGVVCTDLGVYSFISPRKVVSHE